MCAFRLTSRFPSRVSALGTKRHGDKNPDTAARCDFEAIPSGTYALAIIHNENSNGKLDTNLLGVPTEGYEFSNNLKALIGTPSFSAAAFSYNGQTLDMTISLHY